MSVSALTKAPWRFRLCRLIAWAALSLVALPGHAVTFVVNTTADTADALPRDGIFADSGGACSLPAAVHEAKTLARARAQASGRIRNRGTRRPNNGTPTANPPEINGGGILNLGTLTLTNTTVSGNTAGTEGGGIYNSGSPTLTITASTLSGNTANGI